MEEGDLHRVIPGLYIAEKEAHNSQNLMQYGITHVVSVHKDPKALFKKQAEYLLVNVEESEQGNLLPHFDKCFEFIDKGRGQEWGRVLVHG